MGGWMGGRKAAVAARRTIDRVAECKFLFPFEDEAAVPPKVRNENPDI